jgi:hypothetical protein
MEHHLPRLADVFHKVLDQTIVNLQCMGGYVEHPSWGPSTPARLELTARSENSVPGESIMRIHGHIYVGCTAAALRDGTRCPLYLQRFHRAIDNAWRSFLQCCKTKRKLNSVWDGRNCRDSILPIWKSSSRRARRTYENSTDFGQRSQPIHQVGSTTMIKVAMLEKLIARTV